MQFSVLHKDDEVIMTARGDEFLSVQDLFHYLGIILGNFPDIADKPVALCLPEVEASDTLIAEAVNEGDNSTIWLSLSKEMTNTIRRAINSVK
jgi:hypothetical protein